MKKMSNFVLEILYAVIVVAYECNFAGGLKEI